MMARISIALLGFVIAALSLAPILFIGDPAPDSSRAWRGATVVLALIVSWLIGSASAAIVMHPFFKKDGVRMTIVSAGVALLVFAVGLFIVAFEILRDPVLLQTFPLSLICAYLGGGMILIQLRHILKRQHNS